MVFRTELLSKSVEKKIDYASMSLFIGSCFSNNIGDLLKDRKFNAIINPFGTVYNPSSICSQLENILNNHKVVSEDLTEVQKNYCHHDYHSMFNNVNMESVVSKINAVIQSCHEYIKKVDLIFITLGTSWVYELKETNKIVANCHKKSTSMFNKRLLTLNEINESMEKIHNLLISFNPSVKIVYTLSPVRHIKDGIVENAISKALLKVAIHEQMTNKACSYFPAYEYMMDDLRDYRFYEEDLIHPNTVAIKYIWKKFTETYFSESTLHKVKEVEKIITFLNHRPVSPDEVYESKLVEKQKELEKLLFQS